MSASLFGLAASPASVVGLVIALVIVIVSYLLFFTRKPCVSTSDAAPKSPAVSAEVKPAIEELKPADKPGVKLLYGTQTGTAERFSKQLAADLRQAYGESILVEVVDIENYSAEVALEKENLVLFLMATYGDGEPTDNAAEFYSWLTDEAKAVDDGDKEPYLNKVHYGVFALGNRQYEHFCAIGKKVDKVMHQLGATRIVKRGDGDDDDAIEDDFDKWKEDLFAELQKRPELLGKRSEDSTGTHEIASYTVELLTDKSSTASSYSRNGSGTDHHSPFLATLSVVRELHAAGSDRSCIHAEIDLTGSAVSYQSGDHIALLPQNSSTAVEQAAQLLGVSLNTVFKLTVPASNPFDLSEPFPSPVSLKTALSSFSDLLSSPRKEALLALAAHAANPDEKQHLEHLASAAGKQEYTEWVVHSQRSLLEVMAAFPSAKPPLGVFFASVAPRLQPRFYSISSSPKAHPSAVHVTCAVVKETVPSGRVHKGVCSTWLQHLPVGSQLPVFWRHSQFKLPADPSVPIIMVGPGTGLAPFRGFMQERRAAVAQGAQLGEAILFFGCRNRQHDYIYEQELQDFLAAGAITQLHVAFSREQSHKDYVQHHIERNAEAVWSVLSSGGYLYVCGDAKHMAKDVHRTLIDVVAKGQGKGIPQAELFVQQLTEAGRYHRDVW